MTWLDLKSKFMHNIPGVPEISLIERNETLSQLNARKAEFHPAIEGLRREYTIGGHKCKAKDFLFGSDDRRRALSLDDPNQFMIS